MPELEAVYLSLPSLIGPAENLGLLARAECHTNEAVLLGRLLCRVLPCGRQVLRSPQPPPPCAAPRRADKPPTALQGALPPASTDGKTNSDQIKELCYSKTALTDNIPKPPTCFTFYRLPRSRQNDAL